MVARWIRFGYTQELDHANIPNLANLTPALQDPDFDPGRKHSVPWQGGFAGICWNKEAIPGGLESVADLWNSELKGRVGVLSEMRDTMGLIMLENGVDIAGDWGDAEFDEAIEMLREQVDRRPGAQHQGQLVPRGPQERGHARRDLLVGRHHGDQRRGRRQVGVRDPDRRRHAVERQLPRARSARRARPTPRRSSTTTTSPRSPPRSPRG